MTFAFLFKTSILSEFHTQKVFGITSINLKTISRNKVLWNLRPSIWVLLFKDIRRYGIVSPAQKKESGCVIITYLFIHN